MYFKIFVASLVLILSGCTSQPIQNVEKRAIPAQGDGSQPTLAQIELAIISAAAKRRWMPKVVRSGLITATTDVRKHSADIEIPFSRETFSIIYKDSENLDYRKGSIHRNYNRWIANLALDIQQELFILGSREQP